MSLHRALALTSPPMHGADVADLQKLLVQRGFLHQAPDGVYGPFTAQAVFRAKFWLGYAKPDKKAGPALHSFLSGQAKPSAAMLTRSRQRQAKHAEKPKPQTRAVRIIRTANLQVGITEDPPESNRVKFSEWYGLIGPWCAEFVTWVHVEADAAGRTFVKGSRYSFVPFVVADARAGRNGLVLHHTPADAILATFDWQHDGVADHIGICATEATLRKVAPKNLAAAIVREGGLRRGDFWSLEGNTAVGNDSNGGEVMIRRRNLVSVAVFARVVG